MKYAGQCRGNVRNATVIQSLLSLEATITWAYVVPKVGANFNLGSV